MKKSSTVTLGLVASAAVVLLGCQQTQRCVNSASQVVDDFYCDESRPSSYRNFYRWYYGGYGTGRGAYVHGGSLTPGVGTSSSSGVSRGGFGAHGAAHSAGS